MSHRYALDSRVLASVIPCKPCLLQPLACPAVSWLSEHWHQPASLWEQNLCSWQGAIYRGVLLSQCPWWNQLASLRGLQGLHGLPVLHRLCEENNFLLESISAAQALWSVFCPHCHSRCLQPSPWDYLSGMQSPRHLIFKTPLWLCGKAASFFPYRGGTGLRGYLDQAALGFGAPNSS